MNITSGLPSNGWDAIKTQMLNARFSLERFKAHIDDFLDRSNRLCGVRS